MSLLLDVYGNHDNATPFQMVNSNSGMFPLQRWPFKKLKINAWSKVKIFNIFKIRNWFSIPRPLCMIFSQYWIEHHVKPVFFTFLGEKRYKKKQKKSPFCRTNLHLDQDLTLS